MHQDTQRGLAGSLAVGKGLSARDRGGLIVERGNRGGAKTNRPTTFDQHHFHHWVGHPAPPGQGFFCTS